MQREPAESSHSHAARRRRKAPSHRWSFAVRMLCCLLIVANLGGCCYVPGGRCRDWWCNGFKVGPNYSQPAAPVAERWIDYTDPRVKSEEDSLSQWWTVFNDPTLNALIENAYAQNLTLRVAGARILEARAQLGIAVGNLFPQSQSAFADYARVKLSHEYRQPAGRGMVLRLGRRCDGLLGTRLLGPLPPRDRIGRRGARRLGRKLRRRAGRAVVRRGRELRGISNL